MTISLPWLGPLPPRSTDKRQGDGEPDATDTGDERARPAQGEEQPQSVAGAQALFGGNDREGEWVTVYVASTVEEGHVVRGALMAEDIPAVLGSHSLASLLGGSATLGVPVRVPRALEDRARHVLGGL